MTAQILNRSVPVPRPTESHAEDLSAGSRATADGLLPDTLSDRGNAKLFVRLYANDYRHVPGLGWHRWDSTRWLVDEDDTVLWAAGDLAPPTTHAASTARPRSSSTAAVR
jgi:putative DNA primase/helicase